MKVMMNIEKKIELKTNKDLYVLETINNFVITNDGYSGITILDNNLNLVKNIPLFDGIIIYFVYKHFLKSEILLYCCDNTCIVWVNLLDFSYKVIPLDTINSHIIFSPIYFWDNDISVFTTYSNEFYILNSEKTIVKKASIDTIKQNYSELYDFLANVMQHLPCYPFPGLQNNYVIEDSINNSVSFIEDSNVKTIQPINFSYHDIIVYSKHLITFIGETSIQIIDIENQKKNVSLSPAKNYQFLRARFLYNNEKINLITLSGCIQKVTNSLLSVYWVEEK